MRQTDLSLDDILSSATIYIFILCAAILVGVLIYKLLKAKIKGECLRDSIHTGKLKKINSTLKGSGLKLGKDADGFIFGLYKNKKAYLDSDGEGHICIFGGSGKGKTTAELIPSLRAWIGTFFVIDISGDISKNVESENKMIIAPDDPGSSVLVNIFYDASVIGV